MTDTSTRWIPVRDGKLYTEISGEGPAVVLLHGGYLDAAMWDGQVEVLPRRTRSCGTTLARPLQHRHR